MHPLASGPRHAGQSEPDSARTPAAERKEASSTVANVMGLMGLPVGVDGETDHLAEPPLTISACERGVESPRNRLSLEGRCAVSPRPVRLSGAEFHRWRARRWRRTKPFPRPLTAPGE